MEMCHIATSSVSRPYYKRTTRMYWMKLSQSISRFPTGMGSKSDAVWMQCYSPNVLGDGGDVIPSFSNQWVMKS